MRYLIKVITKTKNILTITGLLLFVVSLSMISTVQAGWIYAGFQNGGDTNHASITTTATDGHKTRIYLAGTASSYPQVRISFNRDETNSSRITIYEYIDGRLIKEETSEDSTKYPDPYTYGRFNMDTCWFPNGDTACRINYVPNNNAINGIKNQIVRYRFRFFEKNDHSEYSEANIYIARRQVSIEQTQGTNVINSGEYASGTTNYPNTVAVAHATLTKGPYNNPNFVIRGTEKFNTQPTKRSNWNRVDSDRAWYIGQNLYRFGYWQINHTDPFPDDAKCSTHENVNNINCFRIVFRPNKAEIDNLKGSATLTLEIAHIAGDTEFVTRSLTFTINGQTHVKPVASLLVNDNSKSGVTEGADAQANFTIYTSYGMNDRFQVYYTVAQSGDFLPVKTETPQLRFVWFEPRMQHVGFPVALDNDNINEADETITVTLVNVFDRNVAEYPYTIDVNSAFNSITIAVRDDDIPTVSIAPIPDTDPPPQVQEGPDVFAEYKVTASIAPYQDLQIAYTFTQGGTNKIDSSYQLPSHITIATGTTEAMFRVKTTYNREANNNEGRIRVRLDPNTAQANAYNVATADEDKIATVLLVNNDLPIVSIAINANSTPSVTESDNATVVFDVSANFAETIDYNVRVSLTETGQFITDTSERTVTILANQTSGILSVGLTNDEISEIHGTITATLLTDSNNPAKYAVINAETKNTAITRIIDDDVIPTISISAHSDSSPFVTEEPGAMAKFLFEVDKLSVEAITINIEVTESSVVQGETSDFIATSSESITTHTFPANKLQDILSIPLIFDHEAEGDGTVKVTLGADSTDNDPATYFIPTEESDQFAEVTVKANTVPIISIALNSATHFQVEEADNLVLNFDVTSHIPISENNLDINIGVSEINNMLVPIAMRTTTAMISVNSSSTIYQVAVDNDNVDEWDSTVTVSIEADTNTPKKYVITAVEANRSAAVSVADDDTPVISIRAHEDSKPSVTEQPEGKAKFEIISNILSDPGVTVNILVEHEDEDFIDRSGTIPESVSILAPNLTAIIEIPLTYDTTYPPEPNGKVKITLQDDENRGIYYTLAPSAADQVAEVQILANSTPEIAIVLHDDSASGATEGNGVKFTVSATFAPSQNVVVGVLVTEADTSNFLPAIDSRPTNVTIKANATTGTLEVAIEDDQTHEVDGSITATLQLDTANPPNYVLTPTVASRSVTADVTDDDTPVVSIAVHADSLPHVLEVPDGIVKFLITSTTAPYEDTTIEFAVSETQGMYLPTMTPENVVLEMGQTSAVIEVPIEYTMADGVDGTIVAILEPHATDSSKYSITETTASQSASTTVKNNSKPVITVAVHDDSSSGVEEADNAVVKFNISSEFNIMTGIVVGYTISESHAFVNPTQPLIGTVSLMGQNPSETIEVALENDSNDEMDGTVTLTLNEDTNSTATYTISGSLTGRKADATATDDDIPTVTIASHADSLPFVTENLGAVAKFVISSDIAPYQDIEINVNVTEDEDFLSETDPIPATTTIAKGSKTSELIIPLEYDTVSEDDGMIMVTLGSATQSGDYQLTQSNTPAKVNVKNLAIPVLSIAVHQDSLPHTTESSSSPILFEVTTTIQFTESTVFNFEITESAAFLSSNEKLRTFDVFPAGQSSYIMPIRIDDDEIHELHGTVTVTLTESSSDSPQYVVNSNTEERTATVEVKDDELPNIKVRPVADAVIEGNSVGFELFTNSIRTETFIVNLKISGNTSFLKDSPFPVEFTREYVTGNKFSFEFETIDNDLDGGRGIITVNLLPGEHYLIDSLDKNSISASVVIVDNDTEVKPFISIRADVPIITSGKKVVFTLSAVPAPAERMMLNVQAVPENDKTILWRVPRRVEIIDGKGYLKFYTTRDSESGIISVTVMTDSRFEFFGATANVEIISPSPAPADPNAPAISIASVVANTILNMDAEPVAENTQQNQQLPEVSIFTITQSVEEGETIQFQISSSRQLKSSISIQVAISSNGNAVPEHYNSKVLLTSTQSNTILEVPTFDDNIAEERDSVFAEVTESESYSISEPKMAITTVLDTHDQLQRRNQIDAANQRVVPALLNALRTSTFTATNNHLDLALTDSLQTNFNLGGENSLRELFTAGGQAINEDKFSLRTVLGESSFIFNLSPEQSGYNIGSIWGLGDQVDIFEENFNKSHSIDGDLFVGHFGADTKLSRDSLVGLQVSMSESELTYQELNQEDLNYSVNTNMVSSYYGWSSANQGFEIRAMGGYGFGEFVINQSDYAPLQFNSNFITSSLNSVANITSFGNEQQYGLNSVNLKADSSLIQFAMQDDTNFLSDYEFSSNLNRLITEYSYQKTFERGSTLSSIAQLGGVLGQNDSYERMGIEVSAGVEVTNLYGFEFSGNGQYFLDQTENFFENGGVTGEVSFDKNNDQLGLQAKVSPSYGSISNQNISSTDIWNIFDRELTPNDQNAKLTSEIAWGFRIGDNSVKLTPYYQIQVNESVLKSQRLGTKFGIGTNANFTIEGKQDARFNSIPDYNMSFTGKISW